MVLQWNEMVWLSRSYEIENLFLDFVWVFCLSVCWGFFFAQKTLDFQAFCYLLLLPSSLQSWDPIVCPRYYTIFIPLSQRDVIPHITLFLSDCLMGECRHRPCFPHWCPMLPPESSGVEMPGDFWWQSLSIQCLELVLDSISLCNILVFLQLFWP